MNERVRKAATKVLVPVDGSANSERVIDALLAEHAAGPAPDIILLNVRIPIDSGHARMFVSPDQIEAYYREEGVEDLKLARDKLDAAGVRYHWHVATGRIADTILHFARQHQVDRIVMGTHGRTALAHLVLGSVASAVSRNSPVPVTLIK